MPLPLPSEGSTATLRGRVVVAGETGRDLGPQPGAPGSRRRCRGTPAGTPPGRAPPAAPRRAPAHLPRRPATEPGAGPEEPESEAPGGPIKPSTSLYWGAWIDPGTPAQPAPINPTAICKFEAIAGKRPSILESYSAFFQCSDGSGGACSREYAFPQRTAGSDPPARRDPALHLGFRVELGPGRADRTSNSPTSPNGNWDGYIRQMGESGEGLGPPVLPPLRLGDERQLVPLGERRQRQRAEAEYVAAWHHVHDIFTAVGAEQRDLGLVPVRRPAGTVASRLLPGR